MNFLTQIYYRREVAVNVPTTLGDDAIGGSSFHQGVNVAVCTDRTLEIAYKRIIYTFFIFNVNVFLTIYNHNKD